MLLGAVAQSLPDIDVISALWMKAPGYLLAHRGFTHSILFAILTSLLLALTVRRSRRLRNIGMQKWVLFFAAQLLTHILIDAFNNYGIGWFEPFSHYRFSFNAIYVADPLFSLWPCIAFVVLLVLNRHSPKRKHWWRFGVIISFAYLGYCLLNKTKITKDVNYAFKKQRIAHARYFTTPAPLQNWLWYIVAGNDSGYYVGYRSVFDDSKEITFAYFPRNDSLLNPVHNSEDLRQLIRFSQQFYTVERWGDTLVFNDLRFGQIVGWQNPKERFAFHYFLQQPENNAMVVQRGRFAKWDWGVVKSLVKRIKGN
jgi:inner membrane protein